MELYAPELLIIWVNAPGILRYNKGRKKGIVMKEEIILDEKKLALLDLIDKAGKGSIEAAEQVAEAYFKGTYEDKPNFTKAKKWGSYAAKHGSEKAAEILKEISQ